MKRGRYPCRSPGKYLSTLGGKLRKKKRILVIDVFDRDIQSTPWHPAIRPAKIRHSLSVLWLHLGLDLGTGWRLEFLCSCF